MTVQLSSNGLITIGLNTINCDSITYDPARQTSRVDSSGDLSSHSVKLFQANPVFRFTSKDVPLVISLTGTTAASVTSVDVFFQNLDPQGIRSSSHTKMSSSTCFLVIESVSAAQGGFATVTAALYPVATDGLTDPVTKSTDSLPSYSALDSQIRTLGSCTINSTDLTGVTSWNIQFNPTVQPNISDGSIFADQYSLLSQMAMATITSQNPTQANSLKVGTTNDVSVLTSAVLNLRGTSSGITNTEDTTFTLADGLLTNSVQTSNQGTLLSVDYQIEVAGGRDSGITIS